MDVTSVSAAQPEDSEGTDIDQFIDWYSYHVRKTHKPLIGSEDARAEADERQGR